MNVSKVILLGASGHARVVADIIQCMQDRGHPIQLTGFLDDNTALTRLEGSDAAAMGIISSWVKHRHDHRFLVAIGNMQTRVALFQTLAENGAAFANAIHPDAIVSRSVKMVPESDSVICAGVVVNPGAQLGRNVILNTGCTVDHDCDIGDHVHIGPGAHLAGGVTVGAAAFIGTGAVVIPGCRIMTGAVVGAGAVVINDVPEGQTVVGVPARGRERV